VFQEERGGERYALVMVMPPEPGTAVRRLAREAIFVIDTSGSMAGTSIAQAREALALALARLQPGDTFNVIEFNSVTRRLFRDARPVSPESLDAARRFVRGLRAEGGTEMAAALGEALDGRDQGEGARLRQVVFLTDGAVGNEDQLFRLIRARLGASRLFTVGIGAAPNAHFMAEAARLGGGTFTYVSRVEEVAGKIGALFEKLDAPVLRDVAIEWPAGTEAWPRRIPDLYLGEPVLVTARLPRSASTVRLAGARAGEHWSQSLALGEAVAEAGLGKLWARQKIDALMAAERESAAPEAMKADIVKVALDHRLVSKYTSLVAVETTRARPAGESLEAAVLPVALPSGMVHEAVFGELPQTATPAAMHLMSALAALVLAASAWLLGAGRIAAIRARMSAIQARRGAPGQRRAARSWVRVLP
jgi:Ca-activated chloride channel family protein